MNRARLIDRREDAFSRLELGVVTALLGFLLGLSVTILRWSWHPDKSQVCRENLRQLGMAMAIYEHDGEDKFPYAAMIYDNKNQITWDRLISPVLRMKIKETDPEVTVVSQGRINRMMLCPADSVPTADWLARYKLKRRTYAITRHNMKIENWPPGPDNATGMGLSWTFTGPGARNGPRKEFYNYSQTNHQAAVTVPMVKEPSGTILLTEQARSNNVFVVAQAASIDRTSDHLDTSVIDPQAYHLGKFNYLMVDGHVDLLRPEQTVGPSGHVGADPGTHLGMWTIKAGD